MRTIDDGVGSVLLGLCPGSHRPPPPPDAAESASMMACSEHPSPANHIIAQHLARDGSVRMFILHVKQVVDPHGRPGILRVSGGTLTSMFISVCLFVCLHVWGNCGAQTFVPSTIAPPRPSSVLLSLPSPIPILTHSAWSLCRHRGTLPACSRSANSRRPPLPPAPPRPPLPPPAHRRRAALTSSRGHSPSSACRRAWCGPRPPSRRSPGCLARPWRQQQDQQQQ